MKSNTQLLRHVLILTLVAFVGGTVGYRLIEKDWSLFESFYMTFITLTTIGYGEVHALSPAGRAFTIVLVTFGLGAAATFAAHFASLLIEGNFLEYWRKRRMERKLADLRDHVIVCGFGRIGQSICDELTELGATCVVIENDPERQSEATDAGFAVLQGNATNDIDLLSAGIRYASAVVAALSHDTDNVFVSLSARDLNPDVLIVARAENSSLESRFLKAGVNRIVYPAQLGGSKIAHLVGEQIGLEMESQNYRRAADVLGYGLKIHRNIGQDSRSVASILEEAGVQRALAIVRSDGTHDNNPTLDSMVEEMEAVVLLIDVNRTARECESSSSPGRHDWNDLGVGVEAIDQEHQQILSLIKRLESTDPQDEQRVIREILDDLLDSTTSHFEHEESIFLATDYPEGKAHVAEHRAMIRKVQLMVEDSSHIHPANLASLLESWMLLHIQETDHGYIQYVSLQTSC